MRKNKRIGMDYRDSQISTPVPYKDLYIYYIEGHIKPDFKTCGSGFIGNWEEDGFSFLFFTRPSHDIVEKILDTHPHLTLLDEFRFNYEEWLGGSFAPFQVGRFFITPPWEDSGEKLFTTKEKIPVILDPGVVFGTGTHPTTRDCLEALELAAIEEKLGPVLDLGTGTGVLAIAAALLGSPHSLAVDINLLAARTAKKNIRLNRLEDRILAVQGRAEDFISFPADLVIANIHYDVMKQFIASGGLFSKRRFILSGLLRSQARDVADCLLKKPVKILKKWELDGIWHTIFGRTC